VSRVSDVLKRASRVVQSTFGSPFLYAERGGGNPVNCIAYINETADLKDERDIVIGTHPVVKLLKDDFTYAPRDRDTLTDSDTGKVWRIGLLTEESSTAWYYEVEVV